MSELQIDAYDAIYNAAIPDNWWLSDTWRPTKFAYGSGTYGSGYMINGTNNTTYAQANNAYCIMLYMLGQGWQLEAICGMLGNIQSEGMTQPGWWQSNNVGVLTTGFGLVQWTPATKYINWATDTWGASDPWAPYYYSGWYECYRIACECALNVGGQWISTNDYSMGFASYAQGSALVGDSAEDRVRYAASAWLYDYERPASYGTESQRRSRAVANYNRLSPLFPDYKAVTRLKRTPQIPGPYFTMDQIRGVTPLWWYKVLYMSSRKGSAYSVFSK